MLERKEYWIRYKNIWVLGLALHYIEHSTSLGLLLCAVKTLIR